MASVVRPPCTMASMVLPKARYTDPKSWKPTSHRFNIPHMGSNHLFTIPYMGSNHCTICCTNTSPWDPPPVMYAPTDDTTEVDFLKSPTTLFETLNKTPENQTKTAKRVTKIRSVKWLMWLVGPPLLLVTGMVPTLWLPLSSVFLGTNTASLLSLTGLDCIFNLGATMFLLLAHACSTPSTAAQEPPRSRPPFGYMFWNTVATATGFIVPLIIFFGSQKRLFEPEIAPISFAILLGPYLLILGVQMLTEMLTWHWGSPVWLVTPVVYEAYRVLQLMRGLKLGGEVGAPVWTVHVIRGLVCWWVLVLGVQLMRVAWFAGFTTRVRKNGSFGSSDGEVEPSSG